MSPFTYNSLSLHKNNLNLDLKRLNNRIFLQILSIEYLVKKLVFSTDFDIDTVAVEFEIVPV